jgi:hypothetical protein
MTGVSWGKKRFARGAATLLLVLVGFLGDPAFAAASTQLPIQVIPPATGKSCPAVTFSEVQAHIYSGSLDSFDITLSDPTYVAVYAAVGETPIGLNYLTRWNNSDGSVRTHVDLQPTAINSDLRIQITFLSAHPDENGRQVTCVLNVPSIVPAEPGSSVPTAPQGPDTTSGAAPVTTPDNEAPSGNRYNHRGTSVHDAKRGRYT